MRKNKWITLITVILAISLVTVIAMPTLPRNIWYDLNKATVRCVDATDYKNCVCPEDFDKKLIDGEYICIPHSPETSLDCEWCNKECVEWKKLPSPGLSGCDRTPLIGKVCLVDIVDGHKLCAPKVPVPQGDLITFCNKEEFMKTIDYFEGDFVKLEIYLKEHCDGLVNPLDNCRTEYRGYGEPFQSDMPVILGGESKSRNVSNPECISVCENNGTIVGGRILWSGFFDADTGEALLQPNYPRITPYPTDAC